MESEVERSKSDAKTGFWENENKMSFGHCDQKQDANLSFTDLPVSEKQFKNCFFFFLLFSQRNRKNINWLQISICWIFHLCAAIGVNLAGLH